MRYVQLFFNLLISNLIPCWLFAQDPSAGDDLALEGILIEYATGETSGSSLILDNSHTKVGRDFYDLFYKHWSALAIQTDTTQRQRTAPNAAPGDVVIMIEEIPSPGTANQIQISLDDQPVWQQFVQARYDLLEADALHALDVVRQSIATYQETQQQLGSQDQKGSGMY